MGILLSAGAGIYGTIGQSASKQRAIAGVLTGRTVIFNHFRQLFNSPNYIIEQTFRSSNAALSQCITPNDGPTGQASRNCRTTSLNPAVPGTGMDLTFSGRSVSGRSLATAIPYSFSGSRIDRSGRTCGLTATKQCPWLVWTTFKATCPANAPTCDQARFIEFRVHLVSANDTDGRPFNIPGLARQRLPDEPLSFSIDVVNFFEARRMRCPPGLKLMGRDKRGSFICSTACSQGWEPTGARITWTSGASSLGSAETTTSLPACRLVNPACPPRHRYMGDLPDGTPDCRAECLDGNSIRVGNPGAHPGNLSRHVCRPLNNTANNCQAGYTMQGLDTLGRPICELAGTTCTIRPATTGCRTGELLSAYDKNDCSIACRTVCPPKQSCRVVCTPECRTDARVRCCRVSR